MWQEMSSPAERIARARAIQQEKRNQKHKGPWGGAVLQKVREVQRRERVATLAMCMPYDVLNKLVLSPACHATVRMVCKAWHSEFPIASQGLIACMKWVRAYLPDCGVMRMTAVSHASTVVFGSTRARLVRRALGRMERARVRACAAQWVGARVRVQWDGDDGRPYDGEVLSACGRGHAVRVRFDEAVGNSMHGARFVHTIDVVALERLP